MLDHVMRISFIEIIFARVSIATLTGDHTLRSLGFGLNLITLKEAVQAHDIQDRIWICFTPLLISSFSVTSKKNVKSSAALWSLDAVHLLASLLYNVTVFPGLSSHTCHSSFPPLSILNLFSSSKRNESLMLLQNTQNYNLYLKMKAEKSFMNTRG